MSLFCKSFYHPQTKFGTRQCLCTCLSFCPQGGGDVTSCLAGGGSVVEGGGGDQRQDIPTRPSQTRSRHLNPPDQRQTSPPSNRTGDEGLCPPPSCWIRYCPHPRTRGRRYASYWNAFLFWRILKLKMKLFLHALVQHNTALTRIFRSTSSVQTYQ